MDQLSWNDLPVEAAFARQFLKSDDAEELSFSIRTDEILETIVTENIEMSQGFSDVAEILDQNFSGLFNETTSKIARLFMYWAIQRIGYELGAEEKYAILVLYKILDYDVFNVSNNTIGSMKELVRICMNAGVRARNIENSNF